jgi:hypothetical protein
VTALRGRQKAWERTSGIIISFLTRSAGGSFDNRPIAIKMSAVGQCLAAVKDRLRVHLGRASLSLERPVSAQPCRRSAD